MIKPKKVTKASREKIVREMIEVFKKHNVGDITIIYNGKKVEIGSIDLTKESNYEKYNEPKIETFHNDERYKPSRWNGNDETLIVMYDGGMLYSIISGEFGYDWWERIQTDLERVFGPYHLGIEEIDNVSFTLYDGYTPEYERVADKLASR